MKIFELAKDLSKPSGIVVERAKELIERPKNITHMTVLTQDESVSVRASFLTTPAVTAETAPTSATSPLTDEERAGLQVKLDADTELHGGAGAGKREPTTPWNPARILDVPEKFKDPAFVYRWVNKDKPGNYRKKISEGWVVDNEISKKMAALGTIEDGSGIDGTLQVREMVVMKLPVERAKARKEYYRNKNVRSVDDKAESFKGSVHGGYGEVDQKTVQSG